MKIFLQSLSLLAALSMHSRGAIVFAEDFSEPAGTAIIGKTPDIGMAWTGGAPAISADGSYLNEGSSSYAHSFFTGALGAGQVLTLTYQTLPMNAAFFSSGWAGVSLYQDEGERLFTGDITGGATWSVSGSIAGAVTSSTDTAAETTATFKYFYDTGAWTFTTASGVALSGTGESGVALDRLRIANDSGGSIHVDNITVDISPVPEPSVILLSGLFAFGLAAPRRRP